MLGLVCNDTVRQVFRFTAHEQGMGQPESLEYSYKFSDIKVYIVDFIHERLILERVPSSFVSATSS
jgi:hypothetical protein